MGDWPDSLRDYLGTYKTLIYGGGDSIASAAGANTFLITGDGAIASGATSSGRGIFYLDPADHLIPGYTTYLRVRITVSTNATAPGINFTGGLYPINSVAGTNVECQATVGTVASGSATTVITAPSSSSMTEAHGSDFAFPAAGKYGLAIVTSGTNATNSVPDLNAWLQIRWA